jgi:hypothetical protein
MTMYQWQKGYRAHVPAEVAAEELERIRDQHGKIEASTVVDLSRPDDAPLHPEFEWDDSRAAEEYRRDQARHMIRSIRVVRQADEEPIRQYVNVRTDDGNHYQAAEVAVRDADVWGRVMAEAAELVAASEARLRDLIRWETDPARKAAAAVIAGSLKDIHERMRP